MGSTEVGNIQTTERHRINSVGAEMAMRVQVGKGEVAQTRVADAAIIANRKLLRVKWIK